MSTVYVQYIINKIFLIKLMDTESIQLNTFELKWVCPCRHPAVYRCIITVYIEHEYQFYIGQSNDLI
jgi:hypothetical protein